MCFKEKDHREENETGGIDSKGTRDLRVDHGSKLDIILNVMRNCQRVLSR